MNRIAWVGAMQMEIAPFLEWMGPSVRESAGPHEFVLGKASGIEMVVLRCGVGKVNAAMAVQALIDRYAPDCVIHTGVGGALSAELSVGDVVIARDCVQYDVDTTALGDPLGFVSTVERVDFPCDAALADGLARACRSLGAPVRARMGRVATGDRFLTDADQKRAIASTFGALSCDQESCAVAQVCWTHAVPFAVVRAISDASDGEHAAEYGQFAPRAARIAASVGWKFLENGIC